MIDIAVHLICYEKYWDFPQDLGKGETKSYIYICHFAFAEMNYCSYYFNDIDK